MTEDNQLREADFVGRFDARFPYHDELAASRLIAEGRALSLNANSCVLEQICRAPYGSSVGKQRQHDLLREWAAGFEHPLKEPVITCAVVLIEDEALPYADCAATIDLIGKFEGQLAALNIAYFAVGADDEEADAALCRACDAIRADWAARSR